MNLLFSSKKFEILVGTTLNIIEMANCIDFRVLVLKKNGFYDQVYQKMSLTTWNMPGKTINEHDELHYMYQYYKSSQ